MQRDPSADAGLDVPRGRLGMAWHVTAFAAAFTGPWWLAAWLGATAVFALRALAVIRVPGRHGRGPRHAKPRDRRIALVAVVVAVAAPVAARVSGLPEALSLLGLVAGYDVAAYVVGTGGDNRWEGPAAGVATVLAGALAVAAVAVPPFSVSSAFGLALVVCVAGPIGPLVARRLAPVSNEEEDAFNEASSLRRLSTFLAAGPAVLVLLGLMHLF